MVTSVELAAALARVARAADKTETLQDALDAIVASACGLVPGFDHVGITAIEKRGQMRTRAASGPLIRDLEGLQDDLGEGPCISAHEGSDLVSLVDLVHEQRWPRYVRAAATQHGVTSQLALALRGEDNQVIGVLDLCSTTRGDLDPDVSEVAEVLAAHVAVVVKNALNVGQLRRALDTARSIGIAIGVLMERRQLDRDRAFDLLSRASQDANVPLRDVAAQIVSLDGASTHFAASADSDGARRGLGRRRQDGFDARSDMVRER
jgi:GAF domain-containing protein